MNGRNAQNTRKRSKSPTIAMGPIKTTSSTNPGPPVIVAAP